MSALTMKIVSQLNTVLENSPGQLAKACEALLKAKVNIEGTCCTEDQAETTAHFVVDKVDAASSALSAEGFSVEKQDVFAFVCPEDRPGVIASVARACSAASVNIGNIYSTSAGLGGPAMVFMWVDKQDFAKAKEVCSRIH